MERPSITSTSSAQADGQSCGQVEWRMSILACWFMRQKVSSKCGAAERLSRPNWRKRHASDAQIGAAIGMDRLPGDVARRGTTEEAHHGRDVLRTALFAAYRMVGRMMCRFRLVLRTRSADEAGNDAIHGDPVGGQIMSEGAGEADDAG